MPFSPEAMQLATLCTPVVDGRILTFLVAIALSRGLRYHGVGGAGAAIGRTGAILLAS